MRRRRNLVSDGDVLGREQGQQRLPARQVGMPDIENGQGPTDVDPERVGTPRGFLDQALDLVGRERRWRRRRHPRQLASLPEAGERLNRTADSLGMEGPRRRRDRRGSRRSRAARGRVSRCGARRPRDSAPRDPHSRTSSESAPEELRPGLLLELFAGRIPVEEVTEHSLLELDSRRGGDSGESASELCPDAEGGLTRSSKAAGSSSVCRSHRPDPRRRRGEGDITADLQEG